MRLIAHPQPHGTSESTGTQTSSAPNHASALSSASAVAPASAVASDSASAYTSTPNYSTSTIAKSPTDYLQQFYHQEWYYISLTLHLQEDGLQR